MNSVELLSVSFSYGRESLFDSFSLAVAEGEFFGIVGPNGAGKSTLLRLAAGLLRPTAGVARLFGQDAARMSRRQAARLAAFVPQESYFAFDYTVEDVVLMARHPYLGRFEQPSRSDRAKARGWLEFVGLAERASAGINQLSGGEKQRVVLARALAQESPLLLLDEPSTHLDLGHLQSVCARLVALNRAGKTLVMVSHDLNLASGLCSRLLLLDRGKQAALGAPAQVVTESLIRQVYGVTPMVDRHAQTGRPRVSLPAFSDR